MNSHLRAACAILIGLLLLGSPSWTAEKQPTSNTQQVLEKIPAPDDASQRELCQSLVNLGPEGVKELAAMLVEPGKDDDTLARMALHGLAIHVSRPEAEKEREMYARALLEVLQTERSAPVKAFLIRQLRLAGGEEVVAPLGEFLLEPELCRPAARTLLSVPADSAAVFRKALPNATGECRLVIVQSLGVLRDEESVPALLTASESEDQELRLGALSALASIGDPAASERLQAAAEGETGYARARAQSFYLLFLERLAGSDGKKQAAKLCRQFMDAHPEDEHLQAAGLASLSTILGTDAFGDLLEAIRSENTQIRRTGRRLAATLGDEKETRRWIAEMEGRPAGERLEILGILGDRGDPVALPALRKAAEDAEEPVRIAALRAMERIPDPSSIPILISALTTGTDGERKQAALSLGQIPGKKPARAMKAALAKADPKGRVEIVKCLVPRGPSALSVFFRTAGDEAEEVRVQSLQAIGALAGRDSVPRLVGLLLKAGTEPERHAAESALLAVCRRIEPGDRRVRPLLSGLERADVPAQRSLLTVLGALGGPKAYQTVCRALDDENAEVRDAAVRALCNWPNPRPKELLLELAGTTSNETHRVLALRAYVSMVGLTTTLPPQEALGEYKRAMQLAVSPDTRKLVLSAVARVIHPDALSYAEGYLDDPQLKAEAEGASLRVAIALSGALPDQARAVLERVAEGTDNEGLREQAREVLSIIEKPSQYITAWLLSGPYTREGKSGQELFDVPFPPEESSAEAVEWRIAPAFSRRSDPRVVRLERILGGNDRVVYLRTHLHCPTQQQAVLELGSDDGVKAWLNGEVVHANNARRGLSPDQDRVEITLNEGRNTLLLKVTQGVGDWAVCAGVQKPEGGRIEGLRATAD